jgi:predicted nucleic acid-binding protein
LESPSLTLIGETKSHWRFLKKTLTAANVVGPMTHDARIAAICHQHGVSTFLSVDRDFSRFSDLFTVNPLAS